MKMAILVVALLVGENLFSQEDTLKVYRLPEVVVTATRIKESVKDLPASVTVVSQEEIKNSSATCTYELLENYLQSQAGIDVLPSGGIGSDIRINMRGFSGYASPYVAILLNGRLLQDSYYQGFLTWDEIPINSIKSIEIVRGGVSSIYGAHAMGGVINILTEEAPSTPKGKFTLSYGPRYNDRTASLSYGRRVIGNLNCLLNLSYKYSDGLREEFKEAFKLDYLPDRKYESITSNVRLDYLIKEGSKFTADFGYFDMEKGSDLWRKGAWSFKKYFRNTKHVDCAYSQKDFNAKAYVKFLTYIADMWDTTYNYWREDNRYGINLDKHILLGNHHIIGGADYYCDMLNLYGYEAKDVKDVSVGAIYLEDRFDIKKLKLLAATRVDYHSEFKQHISPKIGINYELLKNSSLYLSVAHGFRPPTMYQLFIGSKYTEPNPNLTPEYAWTYELGIHQTILYNYFCTLSFYRSDFRDKIAIRKIENKKTYVNVDSVLIEGGEFEFESTPLPNLTISSSYTYLHTQQRSADTTYNGKQLAHSPKHKFSLSINYRLGIFNFNVRCRHVGDRYDDDKETEPLPAYRIWDAKLIATIKKNYSFFVSAQNIFDELYYEFVKYKGDEIEYYYPLPRRSITFGSSIEF